MFLTILSVPATPFLPQPLRKTDICQWPDSMLSGHWLRGVYVVLESQFDVKGVFEKAFDRIFRSPDREVAGGQFLASDGPDVNRIASGGAFVDTDLLVHAGAGT